MNPLIASATALPRSGDPDTHAAMLALAERLLAGREAHRTAVVERGDPVGDAIEASVRLGRALVGQWRWVVNPAAGRLPDYEPTGWWGAWPPELAADTVAAADRARRRAAAGDPAAVETADRCEVLAWYQFVEFDRYVARIVWDVDLARFHAARDAARRHA